MRVVMIIDRQHLDYVPLASFIDLASLVGVCYK